MVMIGLLDERIRSISQELKRRAGEMGDARILMTILGVGYFSALTILAEIGDISRFSDEEKLCAYAGLVPPLHQSGSARRYGPITKEGSRMPRWILQECLWSHILQGIPYLTLFLQVGCSKRGESSSCSCSEKIASRDILDAEES